MFKNLQYTPTLEEFFNRHQVNGELVGSDLIAYNVLKKYYKQQRNERITKKNDKNVRRK